MKKMLTVLSVLSMSSIAHGAISVQGRFDYKNLNTKTTTTTTTKDSSGEYEVNLARLLADGKINDSLTLGLELDLKQASGTNGSGAVTDFVDSMTLTKKFGENFSVVLGKQDPLIGGFEWTQADADTYASSTFYASAAPVNSVGASAHYSMMDQTLSLIHLETDTNSGTSNTITDKKVTGALFSGNFLSGMISPRVSYHKKGSNAGYTDLVAAGLKLTKDLFVVSFDYSMATKDKQGTNDAGTTVDAELKTMVAHVRYNHDNFKPFVKYIKDDSEGSFALTNDVSGAKSERTVIEAGLEYVPNKNEDMRYHLVYSTAETKQTSAATGVTTREKNENDTILAGVKFGFGLL